MIHPGVDLRDTFFQRFPIGSRRFPTAAETEHLRKFERFESHGGENVRRLFFAGGAGGAGAHSETGFVQKRDLALLATSRHQGGHSVPQARTASTHDG